MTDQPEIDIQFYQLILSLQAQAWQSLGKVASPQTGKVERSMEQAKFAIDMLDMLQRKTKGNVSEDEAKLLEHAIYELRMNYVEESKKDDGSPSEVTEQPKSDEATPDAEADKPESE